MNYTVIFTILALTMLPTSAQSKNLSETGSYKVRLANSANHLNCRTGPGTHFPVRAHLQHGDLIQVLHITPHGKPWFYTNLRCFVRASSSFLKKQKDTSTKKTNDTPKIIR